MPYHSLDSLLLITYEQLYSFKSGRTVLAELVAKADRLLINLIRLPIAKPGNTKLVLQAGVLRVVHSLTHASQITTKKMSELRNTLEGSTIECLDNENNIFIPETLFHNAVFTRDGILDALKTDNTRRNNEIAHNASFIQVHMKRLLGILILGRFSTEMVQEAMQGFLARGITDNDLPFRRYDQGPSGFKLCSRHHADGSQRRSDVMKALRSFDKQHVREFCRVQWSAKAAVFQKSDSEVPHFDLHRNTLLPFMNSMGGGQQSARNGGYSRVWRAHIAPGHQNFLGLDYSITSPPIAVKELYSLERLDFQLETDMLKSTRVRSHKHVVELLATYSQNNRYYLLFPFATSNLREFWKMVPNPHWNAMTYRWMFDQIAGLSHAIHTIHEHESNPHLSGFNDNLPGLSRFSRVNGLAVRLKPGEEKYGRHGDLKPENILLREYTGEIGGRLQISDFGLGRFHGQNSRSRIDPATVNGSQTYMPPEMALGIFISRKYDIWSLGCVLLEFAVWITDGFAGLQRFHDSRMFPGPDGIDDDVYFTVTSVVNGRPARAEVRQAVRDCIARLARHERCSDAMRRLLILLEASVLVIEPEKRTTALELYQEMNAMRDKTDEYLAGRYPSDEGQGFRTTGS